MLSSFPDSYPFVNKQGVTLESAEVNAIIIDLLTKKVYNKEYGLEIALATLCSMTYLTDKSKFKDLTIALFHKIRKQTFFKERRRVGDTTEFKFNDEIMSSGTLTESNLVDKLSVEGFISEKEQEELFDLTRKERYKALQKLKKYAQQLKERSLC
jgi:hypothetical protein